MSEKRKLEFASETEKKDDWTLSPRFILRIERKILENFGEDECPSWEVIESVLLAYHDLLGKEVVQNDTTE